MIKQNGKWSIAIIGEPTSKDLPISELSDLQTKPLDLIQFYKDIGKGILCGLFNFGALIPTKTLNLLSGLIDNYPRDEGRVFGVVHTAQGIFILYTEEGNYYVLDANNHKIYKEKSLQSSLVTSASHIEFKEIFTTPYYWTPSASIEAHNAHVNRKELWHEAKKLEGYTTIKRTNYLGKYFSVIENEQRCQAEIFLGVNDEFEKLTLIFNTKVYKLEDRQRLLSALNYYSKGTLYVDESGTPGKAGSL